MCKIFLFIMLTTFSALALGADLVTYPHLEMNKITGLVRAKFPPQYSNVNCHATSMVAAGVLTVLLPLDEDEIYFSSGCFREVNSPQPGDIGFWLLGDPGFLFALHSFTYMSSTQIFQKANPGWDANPWEIVDAKYPDGLLKYYDYYVSSQAKLKWGQYQPSPNCFLSTFQSWVDNNRNGTLYSPMVHMMEAKAEGQSAKSDKSDFSIMLTETERVLHLPPAASPEEGQLRKNLLHLLHEYLILPEFKSPREDLQTLRQPIALHLVAVLKSLIAKSPTVTDKLKQIFATSPAEYSLISLGVYDDSRTVYLKLPEGVETLGMDASAIGQLNQEQNQFQIQFDNKVFAALKVTGAELDGSWTITLEPSNPLL